MGDGASLRSIAEHIRDSIDGSFPVEVIGVDMEADGEEAFDVAVQKAWTCLGNFHAFVNCYTYQGSKNPLSSFCFVLFCFHNSRWFLLLGKIQDILQVSEDEFKRITKANLTAPWFLLKAVATRMKEHGSGGSIVFLATIVSGERGLYPGADAYSTASAGVHQLVRVQHTSLFTLTLFMKIVDD